jgi:hypothetical protein
MKAIDEKTMDERDAIEPDLGGLHGAIRGQHDAWRFSSSGGRRIDKINSLR